MISLSIWGRYVAAVGFETMAAFVAILCIVSILLHQRGENTTAPVLLTAGFAYYAVIELGGAIEKFMLQTSPLIQKTSIVLASDLLEIMSFGVVILLSLVLHQLKNQVLVPKYIQTYLLTIYPITIKQSYTH